jgi:hypothetical protein
MESKRQHNDENAIEFVFEIVSEWKSIVIDDEFGQ